MITKSRFDAVIFDLDGVVTETAGTHAAAWKEMFDAYLREHAEKQGSSMEPFDPDDEYRRYVDGKPRYQGVQNFLESRGIKLPFGTPEDSPGQETICGLGNRKNELFHKHLQREGVDVYETTLAFVRKLRSRGIRTAVVSSSKNCAVVLEAAGISGIFDEKVDGVDAENLGLSGKPSPDIFLEAAKRLGVEPQRCVVVEDALAGVQAGKGGDFGCVIGVAREGDPGGLEERGADLVVKDLAEVAENTGSPRKENTADLPGGLESFEEIGASMGDRRPVVFLDYDGTLTPIVGRPEEAVLSDEMRRTVRELASRCKVGVISGRDREDVRSLVDLEEVIYAGSHGFDIAGPPEYSLENQQGSEFLPALDRAQQMLEEQLSEISGVRLERKRFSIAVHYREVDRPRVADVEEAVDRVDEQFSELRKSRGKKIFELHPAIDWDKGKAVLWLMEELGIDRTAAFPLYIGDDTTDEDAFQALQGWGIGIVVEEDSKETYAQYVLKNPDEVQEFLRKLNRVINRDRK